MSVGFNLFYQCCPSKLVWSLANFIIATGIIKKKATENCHIAASC